MLLVDFVLFCLTIFYSMVNKKVESRDSNYNCNPDKLPLGELTLTLAGNDGVKRNIPALVSTISKPYEMVQLK